MSKNSNTVKPMPMFCKVCLDAGKSESEYTSHFIRETRDPNSKVVCPTLLGLECRFCFKPGHTVKYCTVLKKKEKETNRSQKSSEYNSKISLTKTKVSKTPSNAFACLDNDSDCYSEEEETKGLKKPIKKVGFSVNDSFISKGLRNYAAALAAPAPQILCLPLRTRTGKIFLSNAVDILVSQEKPKAHDLVTASVKATPVPKLAPWASTSNRVVRKNNWAAMEESDDEDEDDCYSDNYNY